MKPFEYISVGSIEEACHWLQQYGKGVRILAGGTDLLIELRRPSSKIPTVLLDISRVQELHGIDESKEVISVKPLTTHRQMQYSRLLQCHASPLSSSAASIGAPQIRNLGTVGGNIMNAAACADTVPPLIALGASVVLMSSQGVRQLDLPELFLKPYQTTARPDEILTEIRIPKMSGAFMGAFIKLGRRNALSISRLSVATILRFDEEGKIAEARIVPGAAFPTWRRITPAERMLIGEKPSRELFETAGRKVSELMIECTGRRWSSEYKDPVMAVLVRRSLEQASRSERVSSQPEKADVPQKTPARKSQTQSPRRFCTITATINGRSRTLTVQVNRTLLQLLRTDLGLTGTKCGCEIGECGACTVLLNGMPVNSCLVLAPQIDGCEIRTVEGLIQNGTLDRLQESFMDHDAVHCGYCTPGMLMSGKALLEEIPQPSDIEIRTALSGNLCRCTGYMQIVEAIHHAASIKDTRLQNQQ